MRILFVLHQFYPEFHGGTERVTLNLARAAQRAGHYVQVLAATVDPQACCGRASDRLDGALQAVYQGVPVTFLPRRMLPAAADYSFETDPALVERLMVWLVRERFDLAHIMHPMRMGSMVLAAQRSGLPYLLTLTDFFAFCFLINGIDLDNKICSGSEAGRRCATACRVAPWTAEALAGRYRQASGLLSAATTRICPSEYVAMRYRAEFPGLDFHVIPHGIDVLSLPEQGMPGEAERSPGLIFGFIGSIVPQKGLDTLLSAFARVPDPALRLRVVGGFYGDPHYGDKVRRLAEADDRVELLGRLAPGQALEALASLDVVCIPSRVPETYSLVLHEARAAGVPALVGALGAPGRHVQEAGGGLALAPDDVEAWTGALADLARHPGMLARWRGELTMPLRVEEEAFLYEQLYRQLQYPASVSE